jgi:RNA polymerase sigma factor (sigma-70 family)
LAALVPILLARCENNLRVNVPRTLADTTDLNEEILGRFAELFATDGSGDNPDQLDYYECRFNSAFRTIRIDAMRSETARLAHVAQLLSVRDDAPEHSDEDEWAKISEEFRATATQEDTIFRGELRAAIDALPRDERAAFVLCHVLGYKVESNDPTEHTAATRCGVSGRTIRTRLRRAISQLAKFKKEVRP